jgi:hypothetical protein
MVVQKCDNARVDKLNNSSQYEAPFRNIKSRRLIFRHK